MGDLLEQMMAVVGAEGDTSRQLCASLIENSGGSLEQAISAWFEMGGDGGDSIVSHLTASSPVNEDSEDIQAAGQSSKRRRKEVGGPPAERWKQRAPLDFFAMSHCCTPFTRWSSVQPLPFAR